MGKTRRQVSKAVNDIYLEKDTMKIGIVVFENFTDLDFYLPWDLLNRVRTLKLKDSWTVDILSDSSIVTSATGLHP